MWQGRRSFIVIVLCCEFYCEDFENLHVMQVNTDLDFGICFTLLTTCTFWDSFLLVISYFSNYFSY